MKSKSHTLLPVLKLTQPLMIIFVAVVLSGVLIIQEARAWCGTQAEVNAIEAQIALMDEAIVDLHEQADATNDVNEQMAIINAANNVNAGMTALILWLSLYDGPCDQLIVCNECSLPMTECSGHQEAQCEICNVAISQCTGHDEEQCNVCNLPLSQCAGHQEASCTSCASPISQCQCPSP
jgi:hypothetical protein